jgi:hypothetical protein
MLMLDMEEHALLLRVLEDELTETDSALRRTEWPEYRNQLLREAKRLQRLIAELHKLTG